MSDIRVRFAPSPTGYLHIGSARTALFNWLYARSQGGKFILRIEDTDLERSDSKYLDEILVSLKWLGMDWDEDIYYQSKRFDLYRKKAEELIKEEKAYYEETEKGKAVRLKVPKEEVITFYDIVRDKIDVNADTLDDLVIMKSDSSPTYNFACVVDDIDMKISHIIRGDDHIANTPKQLLVYEALGIKPPKFAHIPLILGEDKSRMSKRHGATSIAEYKDKGYFPEALVNFLALMGWSPKDDREKLSVDQIIKLFSLKSINKTAAMFNIKKLDWLNGEYIRDIELDKLTDFVAEHLIKRKIVEKDYDRQWLTDVIKSYKTRFINIDDFIEKTSFLFNEEIELEQEAAKEHLNSESTIENLKKLKEKLERLSDFSPKSIEEAVRSLSDELNVKAAEIIHPARVALTGKSSAAGIFEVISLIGKERTIKRLGDVSLAH
ncbi:MAG: glutamate--tRNA ligase [Candidatus Omnitrophica bacterium]|nr:glutamate--tRNA ligase [Candidatus Omnitrophota bacterium]